VRRATAPPQHRHELAAAIRQREWNNLLRMAAPVHVADDLVWFPAHMFQVLGAHVERADDPPSLGAVVRRLTGPAGRGHGARIRRAPGGCPGPWPSSKGTGVALLGSISAPIAPPMPASAGRLARRREEEQ